MTRSPERILNTKQSLCVVLAACLTAGAAFAFGVFWCSGSPARATLPSAVPATKRPAAASTTGATTPPNVPKPLTQGRTEGPRVGPHVLDARRTYALGMIETGNNDFKVGRAGEVSRYQIMPSVWRKYSESARYVDPTVATAVARKHWSVLYGRFVAQAGRLPNDFDMYVLWNTRYGYYAKKGFKPARLHPVVKERAQFFVNLVGKPGARI